MQDTRALGIVEAAYDLSRTVNDAIRSIARAAMRAIPSGPLAVAYFDSDARFHPELVRFERADDHHVSGFFDWQRVAPADKRRHAFSLTPRILNLHSGEAGAPAELDMTHPLFPFCVMANTGDAGSLCILSNPRVREWLPVQLPYLQELAHHLAVAWRLRKALDAPLATPREVLRRAVLAQDRAGAGHRPAQSLWDALLAGSWSLVDGFTSEGTRHVVGCKNPEAGAALRALQPRERSVLELALAGRAGKWISFELQLSESTVARTLRMALRRIGVTDPAALIGLRTAVFEPLEGVPGATLAIARLTPTPASGGLSDAERSIVTSMLGGKRVAAIAQERGTSPRTVSNQIASVYRKLGVSSRRGVIALLA